MIDLAIIISYLGFIGPCVRLTHTSNESPKFLHDPFTPDEHLFPLKTTLTTSTSFMKSKNEELPVTDQRR